MNQFESSFRKTDYHGKSSDPWNVSISHIALLLSLFSPFPSHGHLALTNSRAHFTLKRIACYWSVLGLVLP